LGLQTGGQRRRTVAGFEGVQFVDAFLQDPHVIAEVRDHKVFAFESLFELLELPLLLFLSAGDRFFQAVETEGGQVDDVFNLAPAGRLMERAPEPRSELFFRFFAIIPPRHCLRPHLPRHRLQVP
jgi:hypothetical protein